MKPEDVAVSTAEGSSRSTAYTTRNSWPTCFTLTTSTEAGGTGDPCNRDRAVATVSTDAATAPDRRAEQRAVTSPTAGGMDSETSNRT